MDALEEPDESITRPPWGVFGRAFTLGLISATGKLYLSLLNTTKLHNVEVLHRSVNDRPAGVGLITVSNHTSTTDDPAVLCAMMPWSHFVLEPSHHRVRWAMCAREICFQNDLLRQFFLNGKVLPIERGKGIHQPIMSIAANLVRRGDWLHVFPEGRVGHTGRLGSCKQGIGKLICDAVKDEGRNPVVLPFFHSGMGAVQPRGHAFPKVGQQVSIMVGEPLALEHITCRCNRAGEDQPTVWREIASEVRQALLALEALSPPNPDQSRPSDAKYVARAEKPAVLPVPVMNVS